MLKKLLTLLLFVFSHATCPFPEVERTLLSKDSESFIINPQNITAGPDQKICVVNSKGTIRTLSPEPNFFTEKYVYLITVPCDVGDELNFYIESDITGKYYYGSRPYICKGLDNGYDSLNNMYDVSFSNIYEQPSPPSLPPPLTDFVPKPLCSRISSFVDFDNVELENSIYQWEWNENGYYKLLTEDIENDDSHERKLYFENNTWYIGESIKNSTSLNPNNFPRGNRGEIIIGRGTGGTISNFSSVTWEAWGPSLHESFHNTTWVDIKISISCIYQPLCSYISSATEFDEFESTSMEEWKWNEKGYYERLTYDRSEHIETSEPEFKLYFIENTWYVGEFTKNLDSLNPNDFPRGKRGELIVVKGTGGTFTNFSSVTWEAWGPAINESVYEKTWVAAKMTISCIPTPPPCINIETEYSFGYVHTIDSWVWNYKGYYERIIQDEDWEGEEGYIDFKLYFLNNTWYYGEFNPSINETNATLYQTGIRGENIVARGTGGSLSDMNSSVWEFWGPALGIKNSTEWYSVQVSVTCVSPPSFPPLDDHCTTTCRHSCGVNGANCETCSECGSSITGSRGCFDLKCNSPPSPPPDETVCPNKLMYCDICECTHFRAKVQPDYNNLASCEETYADLIKSGPTAEYCNSKTDTDKINYNCSHLPFISRGVHECVKIFNVSSPTLSPPSPPTPDSTMVKDPHLKFANGATADFRGLNNTVFNILSYPNISFSMKTMDVSFLLPKPTKVDGSFFTEAFFLLNEISQKFLLHVDASMPGFEYYSLNTMPTKKIKRYKSFEYNNVYFVVKPDYYELSTLDWVITVLRKPIYNSLTDNMNWRLDTRIKSKSKYGIKNVHGIIGQTFQKDRKYVEGRKDDYSGKTYVKTSAQAEGVIDGTYTDYIIKNVYEPDYKYSMFENNGKNEYYENDKKTAYSDEIVFKYFE